MSVKTTMFSPGEFVILEALSNSRDNFWYEDEFAETYDGLGRLYPEDGIYKVLTPGKTRFYSNLSHATYAMLET